MKDLHKSIPYSRRSFQGQCGPRGPGGGDPRGVRPLHQGRWLMKVVISGASRHHIALETHIKKAHEVGATRCRDQARAHAPIQTVGFPAFMESYSVLKNLR